MTRWRTTWILFGLAVTLFAFIEVVLASESALTRAMGQLAGLLGHW